MRVLFRRSLGALLSSQPPLSLEAALDSRGAQNCCCCYLIAGTTSLGITGILCPRMGSPRNIDALESI